jgi:hypothetical protein
MQQPKTMYENEFIHLEGEGKTAKTAEVSER